MRLLHKLIFTVLSVLPLSVATAQDWDVVQVLPPANGFGTASIFDINNTGTIAGTACDAPSCIGSAPIIHQNSTSVFLDHPIQNTEAFGINNNNTVVGYTWDAGVQANVAEKWDSNGIRSHIGQYQNFTDTYAIDVNDSGVVIGRSFDRNTNQQAAWVWENGVFRGLAPSRENFTCIPSAINNSNIIVGTCRSENPFQSYAVAWLSDNTVHELQGPAGAIFQSYAYGINNSGEIVGNLNNLNTSPSYSENGYFWSNYTAMPIMLAIPSREANGTRFRATKSAATAINDLGNISGTFTAIQTGGDIVRAFFWNSYNTHWNDIGIIAQRKSTLSSFYQTSRINNCNQILLGNPYDIRENIEFVYLNPTGCVCGVNTQDANNNKIIDCMEPTAATKPPAPVIGVKGARVFVNVAVPPPGMGY
ncbi:hypothetical protein JNK13_03720, partial [bacterium]|nr:hypothetical protein [bacterium]